MKTASVVFPSALPQQTKERLRRFITQGRPDFVFSFRDDPHTATPKVESLEAPKGSFGTIDGSADRAAIAQIQGLQRELQQEFRRLRRQELTVDELKKFASETTAET